MKSIFLWLGLCFVFLCAHLFFLPTIAKAQQCPHSSCGGALPCCYDETRIDEVTGCAVTGGVCQPTGYNLIWVSCDSGSCSSGSVCSSNDHCVQDAYGCHTAAGCSSATCCGPGVVPSTSTPVPTSPPPATGTPVPPTASPTPVPCQVTTNPASVGLSVGGSGLPVTASVTSGLGSATVTNMAFGSYNTSVATVNPVNDATSIYQTTVSPVAAGSTAVWATATLSDGRTCPSTAATDTDVNVTTASCTITLSGTYSPAAGATVSVNPATTVSGGTISQVAFTVGNSAVATVCANGTGPCPAGQGSYTDLVTAFNADLTGQSGGSTTLTAVATMNTGSTCSSAASTVNVSNTQGWWQVISGDIIAGNAGGGSIQSVIPVTCVLASCNPVLIKNNTAGFSGVPSTGTSGAASIATGTGTVSSANWRATGGGFLSAEGYNYTYFERKIPSGVTPTNVSGPSALPTVFESGGAEYPAGSGYFWYQYNNASNLNITGGDGSIDLANRKVILFVRGANVTLSTKVSLNDGLGAFYLFARNGIRIGTIIGNPPYLTTDVKSPVTALNTGQIQLLLYNHLMPNKRIITKIQKNRTYLDRLGVKSLAVFGSVARGEARKDSDVDILVEFNGAVTFDRFMDTKFYLEELLGRRVDLVMPKALKPRLKNRIARDLIYVA